MRKFDLFIKCGGVSYKIAYRAIISITENNIKNLFERLSRQHICNGI